MCITDHPGFTLKFYTILTYNSISLNHTRGYAMYSLFGFIKVVADPKMRLCCQQSLSLNPGKSTENSGLLISCIGTLALKAIQ